MKGEGQKNVQYTFIATKGISIKAMENKTEPKDSAKDRAYNKCWSNVSNDITDLDKIKTKRNKTLVNTANNNASLAMNAFQTIEDLMAENKK